MGKIPTYQFLAMMGLARIRFFDAGFRRALGIEDLFFFFWSSLPMMSFACVCLRILEGEGERYSISEVGKV
jgi:hypothetical protein